MSCKKVLSVQSHLHVVPLNGMKNPGYEVAKVRIVLTLYVVVTFSCMFLRLLTKISLFIALVITSY